MPKEAKSGLLGVSTLSYKFQITVPKKAREQFKLEEGDVVMFVEENGRLYLAKGTDVNLSSILETSDKGQKWLSNDYGQENTTTSTIRQSLSISDLLTWGSFDDPPTNHASNLLYAWAPGTFFIIIGYFGLIGLLPGPSNSYNTKGPQCVDRGP